jgi:hypothetical protein
VLREGGVHGAERQYVESVATRVFHLVVNDRTFLRVKCCHRTPPGEAVCWGSGSSPLEPCLIMKELLRPKEGLSDPAQTDVPLELLG